MTKITHIKKIYPLEPEAELETGKIRRKISSNRWASAAKRNSHLNQTQLIFRFALFNLAAGALLLAAWMQGWVSIIFTSDHTGLTTAIAATFLAGLSLCGYKIWRVNCELKCVLSHQPCDDSWATQYLNQILDRHSGSRSITGSALRVKIAGWISPVKHFANSLVLLGLIGTVVGFVIALSGIDPDAAGDITAISPMVSNLLAGMSVALYTTLIGSVLNLWLMINHHILVAGAQALFLGLIELGETNARTS